MCITVDIIGFRNFGFNACANARKFTGHICSPIITLASHCADETTDVPTTEQISLCVRYVGVDSDEEMSVEESFLGFAEANSTTGEELATTIMTKLREYGIATQAMRGQGYEDTLHLGDCFANE
jgi:hypothetical protein